MGQFEKLFNWVLLVAGFLGIVYPAFLDPPQSLTQIIVSYFHPELTLGYAMRVLFAIMFLCGLYIFIIRTIFRSIPITVVSTDVKIDIGTNRGHTALFTREQLLRANQTGVTAYHSSMAPSSPTGRVPLGKAKMAIYCEDCAFADSIDAMGTDGKGYDFIHEFGGELPYKWYMPLIPQVLVASRSNLKFIRKNLATRTQSQVYEHEFDIDTPVIEFSSGRYPQRNLKIAINFDKTDVPPKDAKCRIIKSHGVIRAEMRRVDDHAFLIACDKLYGDEIIRFTWVW